MNSGEYDVCGVEKPDPTVGRSYTSKLQTHHEHQHASLFPTTRFPGWVDKRQSIWRLYSWGKCGARIAQRWLPCLKRIIILVMLVLSSDAGKWQNFREIMEWTSGWSQACVTACIKFVIGRIKIRVTISLNGQFIIVYTCKPHINHKYSLVIITPHIFSSKMLHFGWWERSWLNLLIRPFINEYNRMFYLYKTNVYSIFSVLVLISRQAMQINQATIRISLKARRI